jgi:hypothetical protein
LCDVALPPEVREPALARVQRYCEERLPPEARSDMRLEHSVRGNAITIVERRPPWNELGGSEWTSMKVAQLRYDERDRTWTLYSADRNERWWRDEFSRPSADIEDVLRALDEDPSGIFWG